MRRPDWADYRLGHTPMISIGWNSLFCCLQLLAGNFPAVGEPSLAKVLTDGEDVVSIWTRR